MADIAGTFFVANSDGAAGSRSIKSLGGVVIAQQGAAVPRMPAAAFATDCVDHMLPPETIASAITALCMMPGTAGWMGVFRDKRPITETPSNLFSW